MPQSRLLDFVESPVNNAREAMGFLAFDVETPNHHNDMISQIGCAESRPTPTGPSTDYFAYLINPECGFDHFNIELTGITPADVRRQPIFPQLWESKLKSRFESNILVAHNARFDLEVLHKVMQHYGLEEPNDGFLFIDTLEVARACYPQLPNHKLDTVSTYLNVNLERHHDASYDAAACFGILSESMKRFGPAVVNPKRYRPSARNTRTDKRVVFADFQSLISEALNDGVVSVGEAFGILEWTHEHRSDLPPRVVETIETIVSSTVADGYIDAEENQDLIALLKPFVDVTAINERANRQTTEKITAKKAVTRKTIAEKAVAGKAVTGKVVGPFTQLNGRVEFKGRVFVLTGDFEHDDRAGVQSYLESLGGVVRSGVSRKIDYVVVGKHGSERYAFGSYGTKVEKALELRSQGHHIQVISEDSIYTD